MADDVVFSAQGLSKVYRTGEVEVVALRDVSLDVRRGEFVVLLGASGSGKSTLLNILGGLDVPTSGEVRFGDHRLTGAGEAELTRYRREHVGFVFQFYNLIPSLTVRENVQLVTDIAEHPMDIDEAIALSDRVVVMSAGPSSRFIGEFDVKLPRPRDIAEVRSEPAFHRLHAEIWACLRDEVRKTYGLTDKGAA